MQSDASDHGLHRNGIASNRLESSNHKLLGYWEVAGHFLEENDFRPFPEMIISVVNVFFPKSKSSLQNLHQNLQK